MRRSLLLLRRPSYVAIAVLALLALPVPVQSAAAEGETAFRAVSFAAACTAAKEQDRLVFVDVWAPWCGPCKLLDTSTWKDAGVIALLKSRTVAVKVNADEHPEFAERYRIEGLPTLLVLRPDGSELTRIVGYVDAVKFTTAVAPVLK